MTLADYLPILMLLGLAGLFGLGSLLVAGQVGPRKPSVAKSSPYECGIVPERMPQDPFPIKFYLVAMTFLIFDVEVVFFYPWAVILRELGLFGLGAMGIFAALLTVAFVYEWRTGGLDWEEPRASLRHALSRSMIMRPAGADEKAKAS